MINQRKNNMKLVYNCTTPKVKIHRPMLSVHNIKTNQTTNHSNNKTENEEFFNQKLN